MASMALTAHYRLREERKRRGDLVRYRGHPTPRLLHCVRNDVVGVVLRSPRHKRPLSMAGMALTAHYRLREERKRRGDLVRCRGRPTPRLLHCVRNDVVGVVLCSL